MRLSPTRNAFRGRLDGFFHLCYIECNGLWTKSGRCISVLLLPAAPLSTIMAWRSAIGLWTVAPTLNWGTNA